MERFFCSKFDSNLMTMYHLQVIYPYNITGTHSGCTSRLDDRFDEIFKKSKDRNIQERSKLWGFIAISNVNILAIIYSFRSEIFEGSFASWDFLWVVIPEFRAFLIFLHGAQNGNSHFRPHVLSAKNVSCIHTWELYMGDFFPCSPMCAAFYTFGRPFPFAYIFILGSYLGAVSF